MARVKDIQNIILGILRDDSDKADIGGKLRSFREGDWEIFERLASRYSLKAILCLRLMKMEPGQVPADVLERFRKFYFLNLKNNIFLEKELISVLSGLREKGVPAVPLKGP
ncbi:MAG TPA: nucleotidyltransferase family protein, partial [Candidatus Margulisiibacteriota bacterium]|nr:nucleotidyltransferase family protein [Candidatus Margulisiibacteriota bacterium]